MAERRRWFARWRKPAPVFTCEICASAGVARRAYWDYCPKGHTYVGKRAEGTS